MFYRVDVHYYWAHNGSAALHGLGWLAQGVFADAGLVAPDLPYDEKEFFFLFTEEGWEYFKDELDHLVGPAFDAEDSVRTLHVTELHSLDGCNVVYQDDFQVALDLN